MNKMDVQIASQIGRAVEILNAGGIVAYPTDTVYGVGADAFNVEAVGKIFEVKKRPRGMPLPVLIADAAQVAMVASSVSECAQLLMRHFWPGGLTLVLPRLISFPGIVTAGGNAVAVRVPNHIVPLTIIRRLGKPIIGTSANISNKPSPVTAEEVEQQLGGKIDLIIDMGRCPGGIESTVVDVTGEVPVILRRGSVSEDEIKRVCRECIKEVSKGGNRSRL
jgi:L-threonylcarbamoyladenylate synthase